MDGLLPLLYQAFVRNQRQKLYSSMASDSGSFGRLNGTPRAAAAAPRKQAPVSRGLPAVTSSLYSTEPATYSTGGGIGSGEALGYDLFSANFCERRTGTASRGMNVISTGKGIHPTR